jgi:lipoyl(octanoyl) transferase
MQALPASSAPSCAGISGRNRGARRRGGAAAAKAAAAATRRRPPSLLLRPAAAAAAARESGSHDTLLLDLHDQLVPYESAWDWQKRYVDHMCAAKMAALALAPSSSPSSSPPAAAPPPPPPPRDALVLLQHPPVYTLGAGATREHLRFDPCSPPHPLHRVERGGEVTYHGPGQLVLYPLLDLGRGVVEGEAAAGGGGGAAAATPLGGSSSSSKNSSSSNDPPHNQWSPRSRDLHWYLRSLEEVVVRALWRASRLKGERVVGLTGVWVEGAKVAAVGVRARSWVTYHGVALNVGADLSPFKQIVPCGISDRPVGSVRSALGLPAPPPLSESAARAAAEALLAASGGAFSSSASLAELAAAAAAARDPLVAEYRDALLDAFAEVFDARLVRVGLAAGGAATDEAALGPSSWPSLASAPTATAAKPVVASA